MVPSSTISKQQFVYNEIKKRILENEYAPGMMLVERAIGEALDVSRTPIREAFRRLEQDGLVQIKQNVGVFVTEPSIENVIEMFELREALERMAIKLLIMKADETTLPKLFKIHADLIEAYKNNDPIMYMKHDMRFHMSLAKESKNSRLKSEIQSIYEIITRWAVSVAEEPNLMNMAAEQHESIMNAIEKMDIVAATAAIEDHIIGMKDYHIQKYLQAITGKQF
jgi:DNA-binding GntR family transcriptional regulator